MSFIGCGVRRARMLVTIGPLLPASTMVSPFLRVPLRSNTSMAVPKPSTVFTSMTVHSNSSLTSSLSLIKFCVNFKVRYNKSGMPSPVRALMGTRETQVLKSDNVLCSQYLSHDKFLDS